MRRFSTSSFLKRKRQITYSLWIILFSYLNCMRWFRSYRYFLTAVTMLLNIYIYNNILKVHPAVYWRKSTKVEFEVGIIFYRWYLYQELREIKENDFYTNGNLRIHNHNLFCVVKKDRYFFVKFEQVGSFYVLSYIFCERVMPNNLFSDSSLCSDDHVSGV